MVRRRPIAFTSALVTTLFTLVFVTASQLANAGPCLTLVARHTTEQVRSQVERENPLLDEAAVNIVDRQFTALNVLAKPGRAHISGSLQGRAVEKVRSYGNRQENAEIKEILSRREAVVVERDALELILDSFRSGGDAGLRREVIASLREHPASDMRTVELLLANARGHRALYEGEPRDANSAIIEISGRIKVLPQVYVTRRPFLSVQGKPSVINQLTEAKLVEAKRGQTGSANSTYFVKFELPGGKIVRGVFKPMQGQTRYDYANATSVQFTREVQTYDFFMEYFQHPRIVVPETREVIFADAAGQLGVGSLQLFLEGFKTANEFYGGNDGKPVPPGSSRYLEVWDRQRRDGRWREIGEWIATFDYIIGNNDRFQNSQHTWGNPNNVMVKVENNELIAGLIDSAVGRPLLPYGEFAGNNIPNPRNFSQGLIDAVIRADKERAAIAERYKGVLPKEGIDDMLNRLAEVRRRIRDTVGK
jgi:hypothetical protein